MKVWKNESGFTLIEAMVVVILIGILAAIAVPIYSSYTKRARCAEAQNLLGAVATAAEEYYSSYDSYSGWTMTAEMPNVDNKAKYFNITSAANALNITFTATSKSSISSLKSGTEMTIQVNSNSSNQWGSNFPAGDCKTPRD